MRNGFLLEGQRESDLLMYDDGNLKHVWYVALLNAYLLDCFQIVLIKIKKSIWIGGMQTFNDEICLLFIHWRII